MAIAADRLLALTDGQSGVTRADPTLEGRILALTTGKSGLLVLQIAGDTLTVLTDNLARQYAIYRDNIDNINDPSAADAKDAFEANVTLLEALLGFEPVEELLDAAIAVRNNVCIPGQDPARSGRALIDTYRYIVNEFNLFFDRRRRLALKRRPGVCVAPNHAPRHASGAIDRLPGTHDMETGPRIDRPNGARVSGARPGRSPDDRYLATRRD